MSKETSEIKTYYGNCHCGSFKFNIQIPELKTIKECNCSMCHKKSHKWVFPASQFTIEKGEGSLQVYKPAMCELTQKVWKHLCQWPTIHLIAYSFVLHVDLPSWEWDTARPLYQILQSMYVPLPWIPACTDCYIQARTLRDVDIWTLESQPWVLSPPDIFPSNSQSYRFDGVSLELPYFHPKFTGSEPTPEIEGFKLYTGACHCGAVTLAVKARPFPIKGQPAPEVSEYIQECKCSICIRVYPAFANAVPIPIHIDLIQTNTSQNGTTFIYPHRSQVSIYNASENLVTYMFGRKLQKHMFCRTCGISVCIEKTFPPKEVAVLWPDAKQEIWPMILPINLRILDCVEWDRIDVKRSDAAVNLGPKYVVD